MDRRKMTAKEMRDSLVEELGLSSDEAAHMLVDMGEIDSVDHYDLLSDKEVARVYGEIR